MKPPVIAILDVGKTNKKAFLFDEDYSIVHEQSASFEEIQDEDGFPCEDVTRLSQWIRGFFQSILRSGDFRVVAFNASAYGASLVHLDAQGTIVTPLYNYLKPYPRELDDVLYDSYGGRAEFSLLTASPPLGSLNSGLQLFRLKKEHQNIFTRVNKSLHLPQFVTWAVTGQSWSDITSVGCHTHLWDFSRQNYHAWVSAEGVEEKLPEVFPSDQVLSLRVGNDTLVSGVGLHDSSAALIPYLAQFKEPFLLLSTGTWNITLNPFNTSPLTAEELQNDCLCYLDFRSNPVKASRLFAGNEHEQQAKRLAEYFHLTADYFKNVTPDPVLMSSILSSRARPAERESKRGTGVYQSAFGREDLSRYRSYEEAYHQLMSDIISDQVASMRHVMEKDDRTTRIFVDGGFSDNLIFMNLLAAFFPGKEVFSASLHQAAALGAALAIHQHWNGRETPTECIRLRPFRGDVYVS